MNSSAASSRRGGSCFSRINPLHLEICSDETFASLQASRFKPAPPPSSLPAGVRACDHPLFPPLPATTTTLCRAVRHRTGRVRRAWSTYYVHNRDEQRRACRSCTYLVYTRCADACICSVRHWGGTRYVGWGMGDWVWRGWLVACEVAWG